MKYVALRYGVTFGKGDSSDWIDWDLQLTDEEEKIYDNAIANKLEKLGYKTELNLGNSNSKISIAVYDKKKEELQRRINSLMESYGVKTEKQLRKELERQEIIQTIIKVFII